LLGKTKNIPAVTALQALFEPTVGVAVNKNVTPTAFTGFEFPI
jgi:hypothetical protein